MEEDYKKINMSDHDLLITLHEQIKNVRIDIKDLKDGTSTKIEDHEQRMRKMERFKDNWEGRNLVFGVILMFLIGLLGNFLSKIL